MIFLICTIILFVLEVSYFRLAIFLNIIDKPNQRSLHTKLTIRGGGIIFPIAVLLDFIIKGFTEPYFLIGLLFISVISFLDDIYTLSNRYRLFIQFTSVFLLLFQVDLHLGINWASFLLLMILGVGIINAYNFMDGINGITGGYSFVIILALLFVNNFHKTFIDNDFLIVTLIGLCVFNYFNFRTKALCFAGDVGSISMAFIILFLIIKISLLDNNPIYILFLGVYGIDSVLTIIHRIVLKQNIFKAHRLHLFQVIVHNKKIPHLLMSSIYMLVQAVICWIIISNLRQSLTVQLLQGVGIIVILGLIYILVKKQIIRQKNTA